MARADVPARMCPRRGGLPATRCPSGFALDARKRRAVDPGFRLHATLVARSATSRLGRPLCGRASPDRCICRKDRTRRVRRAPACRLCAPRARAPRRPAAAPHAGPRPAPRATGGASPPTPNVPVRAGPLGPSRRLDAPVTLDALDDRRALAGNRLVRRRRRRRAPGRTTPPRERSPRRPEDGRTMDRTKVVIMGAAGRDFHDFNVVYRDDPTVEVVAITATQIPGIEDRRYPPELAGPLYPAGIPIVPEDDDRPDLRDPEDRPRRLRLQRRHPRVRHAPGQPGAGRGRQLRPPGPGPHDDRQHEAGRRHRRHPHRAPARARRPATSPASSRSRGCASSSSATRCPTATS